ncbi:MAG: GMP synthase, partial [Deltaproteobacteria bacterium HGW-Deltaproteobacteria-20]
MPPPWVILKTGSTLPAIARRRGDFEDWIADGLGLSRSDILVVPVFEGVPLPPANEVAAVVITGSPAMVTAQHAWSVASAAWLREVWL